MSSVILTTVAIVTALATAVGKAKNISAQLTEGWAWVAWGKEARKEYLCFTKDPENYRANARACRWMVTIVEIVNDILVTLNQMPELITGPARGILARIDEALLSILKELENNTPPPNATKAKLRAFFVKKLVTKNEVEGLFATQTKILEDCLHWLRQHIPSLFDTVSERSFSRPVLPTAPMDAKDAKDIQTDKKAEQTDQKEAKTQIKERQTERKEAKKEAKTISLELKEPIVVHGVALYGECIHLTCGPTDFAPTIASRKSAPTNYFPIQIYKKSGEYVESTGEVGSGQGQLNFGIAIARRGKELYVVDFYNKKLQVFNSEYQFLRAFVLTFYPETLVVSDQMKEQMVLISEYKEPMIQVFSLKDNPSGSGEWIKPLRKLHPSSPVNGMSCGNTAFYFSLEDEVEISDAERKVKTELRFSGPRGVARSGQWLYVNNFSKELKQFVVSVLDKRTLKEVTYFKAGDLISPLQMTVDEEGSLYICDSVTSRVTVFFA